MAFLSHLPFPQERNKPMNRDASKSGAEAHMFFSVVSKQAMSLLAPHQVSGNCPAPPRHFLEWGRGKRYWQFQHEKQTVLVRGESKNVPNSWRSNMCSPSIICSAYALHILIRMPQAGSTSLSRAAGYIHCTCGTGHTTVWGRGNSSWCVSPQQHRGSRAVKSANTHTQQAQVFHPVPLPSTHLFQCFIIVDGYQRNKYIFTSYS